MLTHDKQGHTVVGPDPPGTHVWTGETREVKRRRSETAVRQEAKAKFLEEFPKFCTVLGTTRALNLNRKSIFEWLDADPEFKAAYEALRRGPVVDTLEAEAFRRGHDGWDEPVYQGGEEVGTVRKFSDTLLIMLLNGAAPEKYRKRVEQSGAVTITEHKILTVEIVDGTSSGSAFKERVAIAPVQT